MMRLVGRLVALPGASALTAAQTQTLIESMLTDTQRDLLARRGQLDFAWAVPGTGRARVSASHQQRGLDAVMRLVPSRAPTLEELGLPRSLGRLIDARSGPS